MIAPNYFICPNCKSRPLVADCKGDFCVTCGTKFIMKCPECEAEIKSDKDESCYNCGSNYLLSHQQKA